MDEGDDYDGFRRRWRRKFWASVAVGVIVGFVLMGYVLYANR